MDALKSIGRWFSGQDDELTQAHGRTRAETAPAGSVPVGRSHGRSSVVHRPQPTSGGGLGGGSPKRSSVRGRGEAGFLAPHAEASHWEPERSDWEKDAVKRRQHTQKLSHMIEDEKEHGVDDLTLAVHQAFVTYAGGKELLNQHELAFLSIIVTDQVLGKGALSSRPDWSQVIAGLYRQMTGRRKKGLTMDETERLMEAAFMYYGVPVPGARHETKISEAMLQQHAEDSDISIKVRDIFDRYATGPYLSIHELTFLGVMICNELNIQVGHLTDWGAKVYKMGKIVDEVTELLELVLQDYGLLKGSVHRHIHHDRPGKGIQGARDKKVFDRNAANKWKAGAKKAAMMMKVSNKPWQVGAGALPSKDVHKEYDLGEKLGAGGQGTVFMAHEKGTGYARVVKFYSKKNAEVPPSEDAKKEFLLLKEFDHPKIQRLYDVFEDHENVYVVGEVYSGGDLTTLVEKVKRANVQVTHLWLMRALRQVLQGVQYLHSKNVVHCDLKEQNAMVTRDDEWSDPHIVVIDFGLSRHFRDSVSGACGTPGYIPPEVWQEHPWTAKGDVFSLGVMIFQICSGEQCFHGNDIQELCEATLRDPPTRSEGWQTVQSFVHLPELMFEMLNKDPEKRPTVQHSLDEAFFCMDPGRIGRTPLPQGIISALSNTGEKDRIRKAVLDDLAARINFTEMQQISDSFQRLDQDNDGSIDPEELRVALAKSGVDDNAALEGMLHRLAGRDGKIAYSTFMGQMLASKAADEQDLLKKEFNKLDSDGNGVLDEREVARLLERPALADVVGNRDVGQLMDFMDLNHDGLISWEEFHDTLSGHKLREQGPKKGDASLAAKQFRKSGWKRVNIQHVLAGGHADDQQHESHDPMGHGSAMPQDGGKKRIHVSDLLGMVQQQKPSPSAPAGGPQRLNAAGGSMGAANQLGAAYSKKASSVNTANHAAQHQQQQPGNSPTAPAHRHNIATMPLRPGLGSPTASPAAAGTPGADSRTTPSTSHLGQRLSLPAGLGHSPAAAPSGGLRPTDAAGPAAHPAAAPPRQQGGTKSFLQASVPAGGPGLHPASASPAHGPVSAGFGRGPPGPAGHALSPASAASPAAHPKAMMTMPLSPAAHGGAFGSPAAAHAGAFGSPAAAHASGAAFGYPQAGHHAAVTMPRR
eukprot:TRINITY_DN18048_c0_g1_i2.p1 TRINITY_DN18048_c0_g1~~TRINITY_DN18048_c0_g1_i2.p1  ORF type:complete len:1149 (-),score=302.30 TRINITY_DN18048_c0_g1_i2:247-3693(-)